MDKRAAILRAARQLFFDHGLEAVRMDQVAIDADVSKMTVYANFPDKAALFEAVVAVESARIDAGFADLQIGAGSIDVILTRLGMTLMTFLMSPEVMRLDHMLSAEMNNHPGLGQRFYQAGPNRMWQAVTSIIDAAARRGEIATQNPKQAAEDLVSVWLGMVPVQHRFNELKVISQSDIAARVVHGVDVFMKIYGSVD
jgi:TetR/AcrR family transcriptional regulator, mexJK operon transcriptional repressor